MITVRKSFAALAAIPILATLAAATPALSAEAATCPLPSVHGASNPDGTSVQVDVTVTCTLAGVPLFSFPIVATAFGQECGIVTVTIGQGSTPVSVKLTAILTCKTDATVKSGSTATVALLDPTGAERNSLKLNNSIAAKVAATARTTTIVEVGIGPFTPKGAGFGDGDGACSRAQSDHEIQGD